MGQRFLSSGANPLYYPVRQVPDNSSPNYGTNRPGGNLSPGLTPSLPNSPGEIPDNNEKDIPKSSVRMFPAGSPCRPYAVIGLEPTTLKRSMTMPSMQQIHFSDPAMEYWFVKPIGRYLDIYNQNIAKEACTTCMDSGDGVLYNSSYTRRRRYDGRSRIGFDPVH